MPVSYFIRTIDSLNSLPDAVATPLHRHNKTAELLWMEHGTVEIELTDRRLVLSAGELMLIPAGCWHRLVDVDDPQTIKKLIFASSVKASSVQRARPGSPLYTSALFAELERELKAPSASFDKAQKIVELLLVEVGVAQVARLTNPVESLRLLHLLHHLEETCHLPFSLSETAAQTSLSKYHFSRIFKAQCHETPLQFVIRCRMECAQHLLLATDHEVSSVASLCGYKSATQFHAAFTRFSGTTPKRYRLQQTAAL